MSEVVEEVTLYAGPMDAGKTSSLCQLMFELQAVKIPYVAFQPNFEARGPGIIRPKNYMGDTTEGLQNCVGIASLLDITSEHLGSARVVAIDEFTLFGFDENRHPIPGYYVASMRHLATLGVAAVFASGLSIAANTRQLPLFAQALENGADVRLLTARCTVPVNGTNAPRCGRVARGSQIYSISHDMPYYPGSLPTLLPEGEKPDLGYRPVCIVHLTVTQALSRDFRKDYP